MLRLLALIVPLCLDTFAVCAALGVAGLTPGERRRVSLLFPAVETSAPLIGLGLGAALGAAIGDVADYLAVAILVVAGTTMVLERDAEEAGRIATARGGAIVALALTSGLDELAIGATIGLLGLPLLPALALIAAQSIAVVQLGLRLGGRVAPALREAGERVAGIALLAIAAFLLVEKLAA